MGGYNIPLAVNPAPQNPGPMDLAQKGLNVQALINATQLQKQEQAQNALKQQSDQIALQQQQQQQKDTEIFNKAFHDANGDWNGAIQKATEGGASGGFITQAQIHRADQVTKLATADKDTLANEQSRHDALAKDANSLLQIPDLAERAAKYAQIRNGHLVSGAYKPTDLPEQMPSEDDLKSTVAQSKATQDMLKDASDLREKNAKLPGEQADAKQKELSVASQMFNGVPPNQLAWTARRKAVAGQVSPETLALIPEQFSPEAAQSVQQLGITPLQASQAPTEKIKMADWLKQNPTKVVNGQKVPNGPADYEKWEKSITPVLNFNLANQTGAGATGPGGGPATPADIAKKFGMSQEAFDQAAEKYNQTGVLPAVGRGPSGIALQRALMNRAGDLHPGAVLAANSAEYKSNAQSLGKLQTQFDAVSGFENTAIKNIDQLIGAAKDIPDLGARYANIPVRMITSQMIGTPAMAKLHAALLTAQTESAKVLNSATGSGVLTNEARKEAQDILDGNLPFPALLAAANQLKTDMGNRHSSYQEQINDIQKRLGGKPQESQSSAASSAHVIQIGGKNYRYKGSGPTNDLKSYDPI